ncbi:MAG: response regulator transcription factor [Bacteroidales bacterium]|nr:response regulator transcription factor [Bacteroidales bacterium]
MNILYAEDDIMMQKLVVRSLIRLGYEVTTVDDGQEAVDAISQDPFDLVILDLFMPRLSGFEVLEILRNKLKSDIPVLVLSRSHLEDDMQKVFAAGADDYLVKPFEPEEMIVKVTRMLAPKR